MNQYKKLGKNFAFLTIGSFASRLISFFMVPLYTAVLTTAEYGASSLINTSIWLLLPLFSLLMDEAVMRFALDKEIESSQTFSIGIWIAMIGFGVFCLLSPLFLLFEALRPYYWFFILYYLGTNFNGIVGQFAKSSGYLNQYTISGVIHTFIHILLSILFLVVFKWGVYGYLLATDIGLLFNALFIFISCKLHRYLLSPKKLNLKLARVMIRYSVPMIPNYLSWWVCNASNQYMITAMVGVGANGIYSVSGKIPSLLSQMASLFNSAWRLSAVDDFGTEGSQKFYHDIYSIYSTVLTVGAAVLVLFTKLLAGLLFSNEFFEAWRIAPTLILAQVISTLAIFMGSVFTSAKKTKALFLAPTVAAILNIILNYILIRQISAIGAAIASCVSFLTIYLINFFLTRKIMDIGISLWHELLLFALLALQIFFIRLDTMWGILAAAVIFLLILVMQIKPVIKVVIMLKKRLRRQKS